ncbi:alkylhydroperoxidase [Bacillus manliponensis]|uniref:Alkylhydroperoxidase n=1 Tax=Bacillus manliponensis TaxID=574376 RepID=A0A073JZD2_9BACI|nr:carboxymuconolactone decarboxylase family protein [Bacillus manliponensis]KEK20404.1 alkylhydroperoxidase [Bacillus manliponensis]
MERISLSNVGATKFERLLGHSPHILKSWSELEATFHQKGTLSPELKEQVRRTLAFGNECPYCMAKGKPDDVQQAEEISIAVTFAQLFVQNRSMIDDNVFRTLQKHWSEAEIIELCTYVCFITASQQMGYLFQLQPES